MVSTIERIKEIEKEIQFLKIESILQWRKMIREISIVKKTCGLLGKGFSEGIKFEDSLRRGWGKRFKELKI